jgi:Alw26I/Eco31I/Esp3I family type II restriction endonuclease
MTGVAFLARMPQKRQKRIWNPSFVSYMSFIVAHPNYADMPNKFKSNGEIKWVSPSDKLRGKWWDNKITELELNSRAAVARAIHPKELGGLKPCQICGKKLSIFYIYPNKSTLKKLNAATNGRVFDAYQETIDDIFEYFISSKGKSGYEILRKIFDVPSDVGEKDLLRFIKDERQSRLSPGVMSNPPDRLDGFHTYNGCCRSKQDTGRLSANLSRYTQDRRAYENWADGDWNLSNRLMGEFQRYAPFMQCPSCGKHRKMTADHIGPISLGFTHRPKFNPLCNSCNSKKNNRITLADVKQLVAEEKQGEIVISWHSKPIWDLLKHEVKSEHDALLLSKLLRTNLHNILTIFSMISEKGFDIFLEQFLHPEYSFYDYKFEDFNPSTGPKKIIKKELSSLNKIKNAKRYVRISFEALGKYTNIRNRNQAKLENSTVINEIENTIDFLRQKDHQRAKEALSRALEFLALDAKNKFGSSGSI